MYHQFNIQHSYILPTQCIYVISEQTAIIPYTALTNGFITDI